MTKLFSLLFEAQDLSRFSAPEYSLVKIKKDRGHYFALIQNETYDAWASEYSLSDDPGSYETWLCGYVGSSTTHPSDECMGAMEINYVVANPKFPGAGGAMYAFMSKWFNKPITSDRQFATAAPAKKAWARIENSPDWEKVPLDGWLPVWDMAKGRMVSRYFSTKGSWPNREITPLPGPQTPPPEDDCRAPGEAMSVVQVDRTMGSADAWVYRGSLDPRPLVENGELLINTVADAYHLKEKVQIALITGACAQMFSEYYVED